MTTTTATSRTPKPAVLAAIGAVLAAIVIFAGNYNVQPGENGGVGPAIVTAVICVVVAALLFGLVVPRFEGSERTVIVLGVLTVLSMAAFWSGVTPLLAAATLAVAAPITGRRWPVGVTRVVVVVATVLVVAWTLATSHVF
jgi:hypothetical protein